MEDEVMVTKKQIRRIAGVIRQNYEFARDTEGHCYNCTERIKNIVDGLATFIEVQNRNFDREEFDKACGLIQ